MKIDLKGILFRGFHENEAGKCKIFRDGKWIRGTWVYGYPEPHNDMFLYIGEANEIKVPEGAIRRRYLVRPDTLCEAVRNVHDINGKPIFENDVAYLPKRGGSFDNMRVWIRFCNGLPSYTILGHRPRELWTNTLDQQAIANLNIIGNIYENPELVAEVTE